MADAIWNDRWILADYNGLPVSAGPGINMQLTDGKLLISNDETVLWSGDIGYSGASAQLSETPFNFSKIGIEWYTNNGAQFPRYFETYTNGVNSAQSFSFGDVTMETNHFKGIYCDVTTDNILRIVQCMEKNMTNSASAQTNQNYRIKKVVGINRKA